MLLLFCLQWSESQLPEFLFGCPHSTLLLCVIAEQKVDFSNVLHSWKLLLAHWFQLLSLFSISLAKEKSYFLGLHTYRVFSQSAVDYLSNKLPPVGMKICRLLSYTEILSPQVASTLSHKEANYMPLKARKQRHERQSFLHRCSYSEVIRSVNMKVPAISHCWTYTPGLPTLIFEHSSDNELMHNLYLFKNKKIHN